MTSSKRKCNYDGFGAENGTNLGMKSLPWLTSRACPRNIHWLLPRISTFVMQASRAAA
jgi:hypothetical protein